MNYSIMLISMAILLAAVLIYVHIFEKRKPRAREMVVIAMMSAITVVANIICAYTIPLHAGTAVVIITGIALGPEAGVLTGALARFVCNFFMGQGIWTPWEMVAWAMLGGLAGVFFYKPVYTGYLEDKKKIRRESTKYGVMQLAAPAAMIILCELAGYIEYIIAAPSGETYMGWRVYVFGIAGIIIAAVITRKKVAVNSVTTTVYTFVSVFILYGGLMNLAAMFMSSSYQNGNISISLESLKLLYITGIPYDAMHALGAAVCVFLFGNTLIQKMTRIRIKYGLVSDRG